jgi:hypothetical protein
MAFAHKVNRVTMSGTMYAGSEEWTTGFWAGSPSGDAPDPTVEAAEMISEEWQTFFTSVSVKIAYLFKTATIKITPYSAAGVIDIPKIKSFSYPTAIEGAHTGNGNPPQISVVATLVAGSGVGNGGKGRMYLPGVGTGIDTTGHIATSDANAIAAALSTFFANVNASFDNPGLAINAAKTAPVTGFLAINRELTSVRVGNVFDTQRRRRNALAESYSSDTI